MTTVKAAPSSKRPRRESGELGRFLAVSQGLPKYAQLRQALAAAIDDGRWKPGESLPTELELVQLTPFSLGTVQRAVRALVEEGHVVRVKGRGTFVTEQRRGIAQPFLHARFLDDAGTDFLPVYPRLVSKKRMQVAGPWSAFLGVSPPRIARIERVLNVNDEFRLFSRFYIDAQKFGAFLARSRLELGTANYKLILARDYNLPRLSYEQTMVLDALPKDVCRSIGVAEGTVGSTLRVKARAGTSALYFHEVFIPPNRRELRLPEMTLSSGK